MISEKKKLFLFMVYFLYLHLFNWASKFSPHWYENLNYLWVMLFHYCHTYIFFVLWFMLLLRHKQDFPETRIIILKCKTIFSKACNHKNTLFMASLFTIWNMETATKKEKKNIMYTLVEIMNERNRYSNDSINKKNCCPTWAIFFYIIQTGIFFITFAREHTMVAEKSFKINFSKLVFEAEWRLFFHG